MRNSHTTPVTASSFPKWKSSKRRHIIEKSTGREFYFEQDPLSLKWNDITPEIEILEDKETETEQNANNSKKRKSSQTSSASRNEPVSWPEILLKYGKKSKNDKKQICDSSSGSRPRVDVMSLVRKHLNKSKTNIANLNENGESARKNIKIEHQNKSETLSSLSVSTSESMNIEPKSPLHDPVKIKLEPSYCTGQSYLEPSNIRTGKSEQKPACLNAGQSDQDDHVKIKLEPSSYYEEQSDREPATYCTGQDDQEPSNGLQPAGNCAGEITPEPPGYFAGDKKQKAEPIVKIQKEFSGYGIVKVKTEPPDEDEPMQTDSQEHIMKPLSPSSPTSLNANISNSLGQPVSESYGSCKTQSADITRPNTKLSRPRSFPKEDICQTISPIKEDMLENSNVSFAVKLELTRIDDIFNFENNSSVCLNSPTSKRSARDHSSDSDQNVISDGKALELKYQCFSAELKSVLLKRPDPEVLYNKAKLCRHSNRFLLNGEAIECGCVRQKYLKCDICGLILMTGYYIEHVQKHYKVRRYKCPKCVKVYKCAFQFDKHYNQCIRQTNLQCYKCQKVFKRLNYLKRHMTSCTVNTFMPN